MDLAGRFGTGPGRADARTASGPGIG